MKICRQNLTKFGTEAFESSKHSKPNFIYEKLKIAQKPDHLIRKNE